MIMKTPLKIGMIQVKVQENIQKNIDFVKANIQNCVNEKADIIVLCEMWNTPYQNDCIKESIPWHDTCYRVLQEESKKNNILIIGGTVACLKNNKVYNTCHIFDNGMEICTYDKTHLFEVNTPKGNHYSEKEVFEQGQSMQTFKYKGNTFGIEICYDLRFPEVSRLLAMNESKILFCPAAFNQSVGKEHWISLLKTRAMENEVFVVGVNPQEYTYKSFTSYGHSCIVSPFGKVLIDAHQQDYVTYTIDLDQVDAIRHQMPFWQIRRNDLYTLKENKNERNKDQ